MPLFSSLFSPSADHRQPTTRPRKTSLFCRKPRVETFVGLTAAEAVRLQYEYQCELKEAARVARERVARRQAEEQKSQCPALPVIQPLNISTSARRFSGQAPRRRLKPLLTVRAHEKRTSVLDIRPRPPRSGPCPVEVAKASLPYTSGLKISPPTRTSSLRPLLLGRYSSDSTASVANSESSSSITSASTASTVSTAPSTLDQVEAASQQAKEEKSVVSPSIDADPFNTAVSDYRLSSSTVPDTLSPPSDEPESATSTACNPRTLSFLTSYYSENPTLPSPSPIMDTSHIFTELDRLYALSQDSSSPRNVSEQADVEIQRLWELLLPIPEMGRSDVETTTEVGACVSGGMVA